MSTLVADFGEILAEIYNAGPGDQPQTRVIIGGLYGIRTRVTGVRGRRPHP